MYITKRIPIEHFEKLKPLDLISIIKEIQEDGYLIQSSKIKIWEKIDGMGFKIGITESGSFFIEKAYGGPIFDIYEFAKSWMDAEPHKSKKINAYVRLFNELAGNTKLIQFLQEVYPDGVKLNGELICEDLAKESTNEYVKCVLTKYDKEKLGSFATIVFFDVIDQNGNSLQSPEQILRTISENYSTNSIKLSNNRIELFDSFSLYDEIFPMTRICTSQTVIDILKSRVKSSNKDNIISELNDIKSEIISKILRSIPTGKFGNEYEGLVIRFKSKDVKITTELFKERKKEYDTFLSSCKKYK